MADAEVVAEVGVALSKTSLDALSAVIAKALDKGFAKIGQKISQAIGKDLNKVQKDIAASAKKVADQMDRIGSAGTRSLRGLTTGMKSTDKETLKLIRSVAALTDSNEVLAASVKKSASDFRVQMRLINQATIERTRVTDRAGQAEIETARNVAKVRANEVLVAGQKETVATRFAGQQRVQITRAVIENIARLERGLAAVVTGIAKTTVGAVGRIWEGLIGTARGVTHGVGRAFTTLGGVFHRGNSEINAGLSSSLKIRESEIRSSFGRQTSEIRSEVTKQQVLIREMQAASRTGVTGAVSRAGLLGGGLLAGAGLLTAIRKTFTIGADFTRGLAVLQAQLGLTAQQMAGVRELSIQLGNDLTLPGVSALDAAQAIQTLAKQFGYLGPAAIDAASAAAKGTLQLARATGSAAEDAAGIIGAAVNVFEVGADKAVTVADMVAGALAKAAGVGFTDFRDAFVLGASAFNSFVGPAESATDTLLDFNASLAVLARSGIVGQMAGAGLKQFFISASKQTDAAIAMQEKLIARAGETGRLFFDASGKARTWSDSLDILRRSLVGMTDGQRNAALVTLFGNRAFTIANALVGTSAEEYDKLRASLVQEGLAAKIAAAQNTGLKGALDALKSVVETAQIIFYEKFSPALAGVVLGIAGLTTQVLFSNGAWAIFRQAVLGAATGIGALLVAKGAAEAIKLLALSARLLLTPFGLLVVAAGVVGAAIKIMLDRSLLFREALGRLGDRLGELVGKVRDFAEGQLKRLASFIDGTVIPALTSLATWLAGHVLDAFDAVVGFIQRSVIPTVARWAQIVSRDLVGAYRIVVDFITSKVIPVIKTFVMFVTSTVVPAVVHLAKNIASGFMSAVGAVQRFGQRILPYIQPAIDGFIMLGRAVGAAVTGDFSNLGSGALGALKGIGSTIVNAWDAAFEALRPLAQKALDLVKKIFSLKNLQTAFGAVLDAVFWLGEQIGKIASSPQFLAALAAIALGAVQVGVRFVTGLITGILDNLPKLLGILKDAFVDNLGTILGGALIFTMLLRPLIAQFRSLGSAAGAGFSGGFSGALTNIGGFASGLRGGISGGRPFAALDALKAKAIDLQNQFRILGSPRTVLLNEQAVKRATNDLAKFRKGFTDAEVAGLRMRDRIAAGMTAITTSITGAKGVLSGVLQLGRALGSAVLAPLGNAVAGASRGVGNIIGSILMPKDFSPAVAGQKAGESFGLAWSRGIGTIRDSWRNMMTDLRAIAQSQGTSVGRMLGQKMAMGAALAFGGFTAGRAEGSSGGSGLLSALGIGLTGAALGGPLIGAISGGVALIGAEIGRSGREAKEAKELIKQYADAIRHDLGSALEDGTVLIATWSDVLKSGREGDFAALVREQIKGIIPALNDIGVTSQDVIDAIGGGPVALHKFEERMGFLHGGDVLFDKITDSVTAASAALKEFNETQRDLHLNDMVAGMTPTTGMMPKGIFDGPQGTGIFGDPKAFKTTLAGMFSDARDFYNNLDREQRRHQADQTKAKQVRAAVVDTDAWKDALMAVNAQWDDFGAKPKPKTVEQIATDAEDAVVAMDELNAAIDKAFMPRGTSSLTLMIDQAILAVRDSFDDLNLLDLPAVHVALAGLGETLSGVMKQAVTEGIVPSTASLQMVTGSIVQALLDTTEDAGAKAAILTYYAGAVKEGAIAGLVSQGIPDEVLRMGSGIGKALVDGVIAGTEANFQRARDVAARLAAILAGTLKINLGISSPSKVFERIGRDIGDGLVRGIELSAGPVERAVAAMGERAARAARAVIPAPSIQPKNIKGQEPYINLGQQAYFGRLAVPTAGFPGSKYQPEMSDDIWRHFNTTAGALGRQMPHVVAPESASNMRNWENWSTTIKEAMIQAVQAGMDADPEKLKQVAFDAFIRPLTDSLTDPAMLGAATKAAGDAANAVADVFWYHTVGEGFNVEKVDLKADAIGRQLMNGIFKSVAKPVAIPPWAAAPKIDFYGVLDAFRKQLQDAIDRSIEDGVTFTPKTLWDTLQPLLEDAWGEVPGVDLANLKSALAHVFDQVVEDTLPGIFDDDLVHEDMRLAGLQITKGLVKGIDDGEAGVTAAAKKMMKNVIVWSNRTAGISSPSKVFMRIGDRMMEGLVKGIDRSTRRAHRTMTAAVNSISKAVSSLKINPDVVFGTSAGSASFRRQGGVLGRQLGLGLAAGMSAGKVSAARAARAVAREVAETTRRELGVRSPSSVFEEIGRRIGEGLQIGIEDSTADVEDKLTSAIQSAIAAATEAAKSGTSTLRSTASSLWGALTGSKSVFSGGAMVDQIAGWTSALQGFMESSTSTASKAFEVALKKFNGDALTPGEANIFGESAFSLDIFDVLGAENVAALKGVVDQIVEFGSEMLDAGVPVGLVIDKIKEWRDQLLFTSGTLGFNVDDVKTLVGSLGLSDAALVNFITGLDDVTASASAAAAAAKAAAIGASMPGGLSNTTPGGMTTEEAKRLRDLTIEALTLSPADLEVFMREMGLGRDFLLNLQTLQADVMDDTHSELEDLGRIFGGLWGSSLDGFVTDIEAWLQGLNAAVAQMPGSNEGNEPGGIPADPVTHLPRPPIEVNIYPPYGDPMAIGLASANAVALAARIPGS